jgi:hypothetical protein
MTVTDGQDLYGEWELANLLQAPDEFGPVYSGGSVQQAIELCLREWLPSYITAINRKLSMPVLTLPMHWELEPDYRPQTPDVECDVMVHVPGTVGAPLQLTSGTIATWEADVACHVFGTRSWRETEVITYAYGSAVRACIAQHRSLVTFPDGTKFAQQSKWMGDRYLKAGFDTRCKAVIQSTFHVVINSAVDVNAGPVLPSQAPSAPPPIVQTISVSVAPPAEFLCS